MFKLIKCSKGLTLVEVVVSIAILGIVVAPLSSLFLNTIKTNKKSEELIIANQLAQNYMEKLKFGEKVEVTSTKKIIATETTAKGVFKVYKDIRVLNDTEYVIEGSKIPTYDADIYIKEDKVTFLGDSTKTETISDNTTIEIDVEKNSSSSATLKFNDNNNYTKSNIDIISPKDYINIKVLCETDKIVNLEVNGLNDIKTNIYVVKAKETSSDIADVIIEKGKVNVYKNIYEEKSSKDEKNWVYKITVYVEKTIKENGIDKDVELVKLVGLKKID